MAPRRALVVVAVVEVVVLFVLVALLVIDEVGDACHGRVVEERRDLERDARFFADEVDQSAEQETVSSEQEEIGFGGDGACLGVEELGDDVAHDEGGSGHARGVLPSHLGLHGVKVDLTVVLGERLAEDVERVGDDVAVQNLRQRTVDVGCVVVGVFLDLDESLGSAVAALADGGLNDAWDAVAGSLDGAHIDADKVAGDGLGQRHLLARRLGLEVTLEGRNVVRERTDAETGSKLDAERLARLVLGEVVHVDGSEWPFGRMQMRAEHVVQFGQTDARLVRHGDNDNTDGLLEDVVLDGKGEALLYAIGARLCDCLFDLEGRDDLAALVDDLLGTTGDVEVAVGVHVSHVARVEPALAGEGGGVERFEGIGRDFVAGEGGQTAHRDGAGLTDGELPLLVEGIADGEIGTAGYTRAAGTVELVVCGR